MMSVFTTLLLIPFFLCLIHGAPNQKPGEDSVRDGDPLGPRQNHYPFVHLYSGSVALPSAWPSLTNPFSTGTGPSTAPTGTTNTGGGSAISGGLQPYPTQGAPYQNYTSPYNPLGSGGLVTVPTSPPPAALSIESAAAAVGSSTLSNECPPPQTVTLPPQTITLPAETITVTAAPQTVTVTSEVQQTQTITITQQVQTQTVTITVTITAGPAQAGPSNAGSPEVPPVAAPSNAVPAAPSNAPGAGSVPNNEGQNQLPAQTNGPAPGPIPPPPSSQIPAPALPTNIAVPLAAPATPSAPAAPTVPPAIPGNEGPESVPAAAPPTTPNVQPSAQPSTPSGSAPTFNAPIPPPNTNPVVGPSAAPPGFLPTAPYQNTTGPHNMTRPCGSGMSGTMPGTRPGTIPGTGYPHPTGGIMPPIGLPLPSGYSRQFIFPTNAPSGAILSGLAGPTALLTVPTSLSTQPAAQSDIGPNSPLIILPPALPTVPPMPPTNQSDIQGPPLSPFSTSTECSLNGTSEQNITTNYSTLSPSPPTSPLIYLGLNYTSFTLSPLLHPAQLTSPATSSPKAISISPPFLSYSLTSLSLSCGPDIPVGDNCTIDISAYGAPPTSGGAPAPASAMGGAAGDVVSNAGFIRRVDITGPELQLVGGFEGWEGLWQVNFTARWGDVEMGVGVGEVRYAVLGVCEGGVGGTA